MKKVIYSSLFAMLLLVLCQSISQAQQVSGDTVVNFVKMKNPPTYPGGLPEFYKFLGKNMRYPTQAIRDKVQGNVYLSFIVDTDGSIIDVKVDRRLGAGTDEEAVRVIKMSGRWNPGTVEGKPVRVVYRIPVKFSMKG